MKISVVYFFAVESILNDKRDNWYNNYKILLFVVIVVTAYNLLYLLNLHFSHICILSLWKSKYRAK